MTKKLMTVFILIWYPFDKYIFLSHILVFQLPTIMNKNLKIKGLKCSIITVSVFEEGVSAVPASVGRGQVSENQGL